MTEPFKLTPEKQSKGRVRRGGWTWGPLDGAKLRVLSFGGGVQSSTLVYMMLAGELPWPDAIIYADTGDDGPATGAHIDQMEAKVRQATNHCQFIRVGQPEKLSDMIRRRAVEPAKDGKRFIAAPFYTDGGGQGRRQCTREYKIEPIEKEQRRLLGFKPRQIIPPGSCEVNIGISTDEVQRAGSAFARWCVNRYPLLELRMSRRDCIAWLEKRGIPVPPKSACFFCPYRSNLEWRRLQTEQPEQFAAAVEIDRLIRTTPSMRRSEYLHQKRVPLDTIDFANAEDNGQGFLSHCDGGCGL